MSDDFDLDEDLKDPGDVDDGPHCVECRCSYSRPCAGGCVWATPDLCSRCA